MSCTKPLQAYESEYCHPSGKKKLVFHPAKSVDGEVIPLPCGQCESCRLTRSKVWAFRCVKEAELYEENHFLTLTYDPEHLPRDLSLHKSHFQKFIRAVRDKFRKTNPKIRFYMCGEYGEASAANGYIARPHYHALIFNFSFPDQRLIYTRPDGDRVYDSEICKRLWGKGSIEIGTLNMKSAAYVARYVLKKVGTKDADKINPETGLRHYEVWNPFTQSTNRVLPEYTQMSNRPGIASKWFDKYKSELYPRGEIYLGYGAPFPGDKRRPLFMKSPAYFDKLLERENPELMERVSEKRKQYAKDNAQNFTEGRLNSKAILVSQRVSNMKRKL